MKVNDPIGFAKKFATMCHEDAGQSYDGQPYSTHLQHVVTVLMRYNETDKTMLASGWLHDVMEDVGISLETIRDLFGSKVATLVHALTDEPGENRKERKVKTYPKIRATSGAVQLKLADRIANIENSLKTSNGRMFLMYMKEHPEFEKALRPGSTDVEEAMWKNLDYLFALGDSRFKATYAMPQLKEIGE